MGTGWTYEMNHKRKRPKNRRAGCLMCKPNKMNGWSKTRMGHKGFGNIRKLVAASTIIISGCTSTNIELLGDIHINASVGLGEEECLKIFHGSSVGTLSEP